MISCAPSPVPGELMQTDGGHFIVKDANDFALAYVFARSDSALHDKYLTPAEALVIAEAIVKLPLMR